MNSISSDDWKRELAKMRKRRQNRSSAIQELINTNMGKKSVDRGVGEFEVSLDRHVKLGELGFCALTSGNKKYQGNATLVSISEDGKTGKIRMECAEVTEP